MPATVRGDGPDSRRPSLRDGAPSTFGCALVGAALLWAALPPLDFWPLAWIAPVAWVLLIRMERLRTGESTTVGTPTMRAWCPVPTTGNSAPLAAIPRRPALILLLLAAGLFLAWMVVNGQFLNRQYRMYWTAELVFWPAGFLLLLGAVRAAGHRPYLVIWLVGFFFWLAALQWLRLPHWATGFGWLALSFYFAFYLPVFIGVSRVAVHRFRVPVILAAPIVWTGLELARAHLLTGMTMASLGHTQYRWIELIQISDLAGAFGVSFVVMFVAACLARMIPCGQSEGTQGVPGPIFDKRKLGQSPTFRNIALWPLLPAGGLLAATLVYGYVRTSDNATSPGPRVALIQGCVDTQMESDEGLRDQIFRQYFDLSRQAIAEYGRVDLVVWPETMFAQTWVTCDEGAAVPDQYADLPAAEFRRQLELVARQSRQVMGDTARALGTSMIFGVDRRHFGRKGVRFFNSAVQVSPQGDIVGCYDKIHLVMFGEYVPLAERFPWLHRLTPLSVSVTPGEQAVGFALGGVGIAPDICYESVLSHVIRRQICDIQHGGDDPAILVNVTNDGWFWGSSELSMHFACGVFRAVECHRPLLIAANTGISGWIDGDGRVRARGNIHSAETLLAEVRLDHRGSWYLRHGDWAAGVCLVLSAVCVVAGIRGRRLRFGH